VASPPDADFISDLFSEFGPVSVRRMFGGAGISVDGATFAIVFDGVIYLKTDDASRAAFESEGSAPFVYPLMKKPRPRRKPSSFWRLPDRLYDDPAELAAWSQIALGVARKRADQRAAKTPAAKRPPRRSAAKPASSRKKSAAKRDARRRSS
jgi:DNA transformation protein